MSDQRLGIHIVEWIKQMGTGEADQGGEEGGGDKY
ncbi:Uncharacterised protein [Edwardsiella tarda]|nr:Uncharacterised protein [Edwardsiella tarda]